MSKSTASPANNVNTSALASSAMLVDLTIRTWQGKKTDKRATKELHELHKASAHAGEYRKRLLGECGPLKDVLDIASEGNRKHRELTLPWADDGHRILAATGFLHYQDVMGKLRGQFNLAFPAFLKEYPYLRELAHIQLGTMYTAEDYPEKRELGRKFDFDWSITALPLASDFRVNIKDTEAAQIKQQIEANTTAALNNALHDAYARAAQVVEHMVERLRAYKMTDKGLVGKFHDTLTSNISDIADMLPMLNVTGGSELLDLSKRLKAELLEYTAQDLRDSKAKRAETVKKANEILAAIKQIAA